MLSRNFGLQTVGGLDWLRESYSFDAIAFSIDELVVLNVGRAKRDIEKFSHDLMCLSKSYFLPISAGGGIRSLDDAYMLLNANVDKLVVNTAIINDPGLVTSLARTFGSQCVIASIDCRKVDGDYYVCIENGSKNTSLKVEEVIKKATDIGAGEIYLTSMDKDGTGFGYDLDLIERTENMTRLPIIVSGGVGKYQHFVDGLNFDHVTGASTANIFNFIVDGLINARKFIQESGIELASWNYCLDDLCNYFNEARS